MRYLVNLMIVLLVLAGYSMAVHAQGIPQVSKNFKPTDYPCLSDKMKCGKMRTPVRKTLVGELKGDPKRGKAIAFKRSKGNCLACHKMAGGSQPGNRGVDLTKYAALGRTDGDVYTLVYDMRIVNPGTVMPPIGTNGVLSDQEIRDVVAFLQNSK
jgi:L-cysteine S-thiosulfotransferase